MKNKIFALLTILCLCVLLFAGCAPKETDPNPEVPEEPATLPAPASQPEDRVVGTWTVAIEGVDGVSEFTSEDALALEEISIEMTITNSKGEEKTNVYTGVLLKDILAHIGAEGATKVTVVADDDFAVEYDATLINAEDTLLAWAVDGDLIDSDQPLRMCPYQGTGNQFVKNTAKLIIG